jgi:hypothetical protein
LTLFARYNYFSNMSDFDFNEHVQENSGYYGAVAGISHLRNQQKQNEELRKQRGLLEEQAKAAKDKAATERQRLKVEKQRLELDKQRLELDKQEAELRRKEAEHVKELRKLMAGMSGELDEIDARFA